MLFIRRMLLISLKAIDRILETTAHNIHQFLDSDTVNTVV